MRRIVFTLAALSLLAVAPAAEAKASWAKPQIKAVVKHGLMAPTPGAFRPKDLLTRGELAEIVGALTSVASVVEDPTALVTVSELDAELVRALGLGPAADLVQAQVAAAGLKPPARLGTETVARILGLRASHEGPDEALELGPEDPVTRAETAYSVARALALTDGERAWIDELAATLVPPPLSEWQRAVLSRAVQLVGYPYVWGGSSELEQGIPGQLLPGGFDCSGFIWRVYKLEPYENAPYLAEMIQGRSTYDMSAEVTRKERVKKADLQPGDIVFFGSRGKRSKPAEIGHVGIYFGSGWLVHASRLGTTLSPLTDWYDTNYAWARRPSPSSTTAAFAGP
jgi:cell wall-associated NlpC family hydrolase